MPMAGAVRDGIDVETAGDRADVQRRPAEHIVARDIEIEILQSRDGAGGLVDRIDAFLRHRAVCGQPFCDRLEPQRAFMADHRPVAGWLCHDKRADFRQAFELLRKRCSAGAAGFLPRRDDQHHAGRTRELVWTIAGRRRQRPRHRFSCPTSPGRRAFRRQSRRRAGRPTTAARRAEPYRDVR